MSEVKRYIIGRNGLPEFHDSGEYVATSDYDALAAEAQSLREEVEKAQNALAFTEQWHGVRYERLWHWAHAELDEEQKRRYFNIVANGTAEHSEPPTYAQQLCRMKHRYECAEKEVAALRARVVVVPERKLLNAGVPGLNRNSAWNACLDELARINGMTVSEGLVQGMAKFAREIICGALDGGSFDGADIQESAERHGLIAKQVMNEPCRGPEEYCACAWSTSFPAECYRVTPEIRALLSEQEGGKP
ncbi:TPA: hypothetical protein L4747_000552 [Pseudomonas aeruginosa]|uniref:hypothetical protein n=1 Tax=Pseudomonas aeruginosa TaxID=287 RepID=UPI00376F590D|nr:hypothetical protein [Pseudomonas aeruginosa]HBO6331250.1 hypothetical protein [Pseudomonas aeruginosa]HBP1180901.1 hypothetical protein [Pseudomonas aeruginosa]HCF1883446.1 hypothetical protein [Pseudomonas aeruginosa]